jgi:hypothetical protein
MGSSCRPNTRFAAAGVTMTPEETSSDTGKTVNSSKTQGGRIALMIRRAVNRAPPSFATTAGNSLCMGSH